MFCDISRFFPISSHKFLIHGGAHFSSNIYACIDLQAILLATISIEIMLIIRVLALTFYHKLFSLEFRSWRIVCFAQSSLNERLHEKHSAQNGRDTLLSSTCEMLLATIISFMAHIGFAMTKLQIIDVVNNYAWFLDIKKYMFYNRK